MKTFAKLALVFGLAVVAAGLVAGDVLAQCGTTAGCGDPNCGMCASKATAVTISLEDLSPDELKLVKHLADLIEKNTRVEFNVASAAEATGLSEEAILGFDEDRIEAGVIAELKARGFDTANISFGGGSTCSEYGACSVDANLAGASGDLLASYAAERETDGKSYVAWRAPDFTLPTTDGKEVSLSDYKGRPVALLILATHCNHCVDTMPMLAKLQEKYEKDLVILPVVNNAKSVDAAKSWAKRLKVEYPLLVSTDKSLSKLYKAQLVPTAVLINAKGFVTKKLITYKNEATLDLAFGDLVKAANGGSGKGSK